MKQCPAILNNPHATVEDGIVFAEILLFSTLYHKLGDFPLLDEQGQCEELTACEDKWIHLLGIIIPLFHPSYDINVSYLLTPCPKQHLPKQLHSDSATTSHT
jgi:hypothetical protein